MIKRTLPSPRLREMIKMNEAISRVAGVTYQGRQDILATLRDMNGELEGRLVREPGDQYDPQAIAVQFRCSDVEWQHIGYIPAPVAAKWAPHIDMGMKIAVTDAKVHTTRKGHGASVKVEFDWIA